MTQFVSEFFRFPPWPSTHFCIFTSKTVELSCKFEQPMISDHASVNNLLNQSIVKMTVLILNLGGAFSPIVLWFIKLDHYATSVNNYQPSKYMYCSSLLRLLEVSLDSMSMVFMFLISQGQIQHFQKQSHTSTHIHSLVSQQHTLDNTSLNSNNTQTFTNSLQTKIYTLYTQARTIQLHVHNPLANKNVLAIHSTIITSLFFSYCQLDNSK